MEAVDEAQQILRKRPIAVDLFSGVGGLSLGLEQSGFYVELAVEKEEKAGRYAQFNFPHSKVLYGEDGDVKSLSPSDIEELVSVNGGQIDLIAGGPPCQGFSIAGKKNADDPLNSLVVEFAKRVTELSPKAFLMENVPGMKKGKNKYLDKALDLLGEKYDIKEPTELLAFNYGVPQSRKRVFILGIRDDINVDPSLPEPSHQRPDPGQSQKNLNFLPNSPTVWDAIEDIPKVDEYPELIDADRIPYDREPTSDYSRIMRGFETDPEDLSPSVVWDKTTCTNIRRTRHGDEIIERFDNLDFGEADSTSGIRRLEPSGVSTTIRAGTTKDRGAWSAPRPLHPYQNRVITTRECARMQSFPDYFLFHPTKWHGNRQVGNAVPPLLARAIGKHLIEILDLEVPSAETPKMERDRSLVDQDIKDAAGSGLSEKDVSQQVIHPD